MGTKSSPFCPEKNVWAPRFFKGFRIVFVFSYVGLFVVEDHPVGCEIEPSLLASFEL